MVPQFLFDFINSVSIIKFLLETRAGEMRKNYSRGAVFVIPIIFPSLGMKNGIRVPRQEATLCSQLEASWYKYWTLVTFLVSNVFMTIRGQVLKYQIDRLKPHWWWRCLLVGDAAHLYHVTKYLVSWDWPGPSLATLAARPVWWTWQAEGEV